ncbi:hypothetical protein CBW65_03900 [Tumebacillus avium]|uniref:HTH arsR-type domain-containing protein n=1 Tax=Tumebacillus avium TaxID=1903704 RepID=A0A1Y0IT57_9BACL|nr:helix-turn-helix transcriptional regulator [Tumebacillus avium]ARU63778.1 hypothetical protein CBW65_03900 [Tumebacillus avium]
MNAYPDFSSIASLLGDPTRATVLEVPSDGRALPASDLARHAGVTPQTISAHLGKLMDGGLLLQETHGRHRYYKLSGPDVGHAIEALSLLAPPVKVRSLRQSAELEKLRTARTCYDHLAGQFGVDLTQALLDNQWLIESEQGYQVTERGGAHLQEWGVDWRELQNRRRNFAKPCLDWSERRYHLAGALGAGIAERLFEMKWIQKKDGSRTVTITVRGKEKLKQYLGIEC